MVNACTILSTLAYTHPLADSLLTVTLPSKHTHYPLPPSSLQLYNERFNPTKHRFRKVFRTGIIAWHPNPTER